MKKSILAFATSALFASSSHAVVIKSDTTAITTTAQSYASTVSLGNTKYKDVSLALTAKGDYGRGLNEFIDFYINGSLLAHWAADNNPPASVVENYPDYDYTLTGTINLSAVQWASLAQSGVLNIRWSNTADVDAYPAEGGADYVKYTLSGTVDNKVPEPTSLALLGLGLAGLGLASRRKA